jgi:hypothetical protein
MALLDATNRARVAMAYMRELSGSWAFTKPQLAAAVSAADQWVEDNATSFNTALPAAFRTSATAIQKTYVLAYVLMRRVGKARVTEDG